MDPAQGIWLIVVVLIAAALIRAGRRRPYETRVGGPGTGAAGAIYDLLNQDKRNAIEIIVEEKAEERDPETADGNLPDLERPDRR